MRTTILMTALLAACAGGKSDDTSTTATDDTDAALDTDTPTTDDTDPVDDTDPAPVDDTDPSDDSDVDDTSGPTAHEEPVLTDIGIIEVGVRQWADYTVASSCYEYLHPPAGYAYTGATGDGTYLISPDGVSFSPAWCDMTNEGGGWTLVAQLTPTIGGANLCAAAAAGTLDHDNTTVTAPAKLADSFIQGVWEDGGARALHLRTSWDTTDPTRTGWTTACVADFADTQTFDVTAATNAWTLDGPLVCDGVAQTSPPTTMLDPSLCGYAFISPGTYRNTIWSSPPSYTGGACGLADSGRSWVNSTGNYGCNVTKVFAR